MDGDVQPTPDQPDEDAPERGDDADPQPNRQAQPEVIAPAPRWTVTSRRR